MVATIGDGNEASRFMGDMQVVSRALGHNFLARADAIWLGRNRVNKRLLSLGTYWNPISISSW